MTAVAPPQARELTEQEMEERAALCHAINERIKAVLSNTRLDLWQLAEALYEFNEQNGWTALGYESQSRWLADPEISMTKVTFARMVRRYKQLVVVRQLPVSRDPEVPEDEQPEVVLSEVDPSKLDIVMRAIEKGKKPVNEILVDARELGARDLRDEYGVPQPEDAGKDDEPVDTTAQPVNAADQNGSDPEAEERARLAEQLMESATMVDSWLEMGGDRRKAQRHFRRLVSLHPVLIALARIEACVDGGDEAPDRTAVADDWQTVTKGLRLSFRTE